MLLRRESQTKNYVLPFRAGNLGTRSRLRDIGGDPMEELVSGAAIEVDGPAVVPSFPRETHTTLTRKTHGTLRAFHHPSQCDVP